jgi:hypothetical protein
MRYLLTFAVSLAISIIEAASHAVGMHSEGCAARPASRSDGLLRRPELHAAGLVNPAVDVQRSGPVPLRCCRTPLHDEGTQQSP